MYFGANLGEEQFSTLYSIKETYYLEFHGSNYQQAM
jgi:hypothetical protein